MERAPAGALATTGLAPNVAPSARQCTLRSSSARLDSPIRPPTLRYPGASRPWVKMRGAQGAEGVGRALLKSTGSYTGKCTEKFGRASAWGGAMRGRLTRRCNGPNCHADKTQRSMRPRAALLRPGPTRSSGPSSILHVPPRDPRGPRLCAAACGISYFVIETLGILRASQRDAELLIH